MLKPVNPYIGKRTQGHSDRTGNAKTAVISYADDVTIFLTSPAVVRKLQETLLTYEAGTGAKVNMRKSRALALGAWDTTTRIMDIPYHTDVTILGFHFTNKVNISAHVTWSTVTTRVRALAQDTYYRDLSLDRRIRFVHDYLLAKIWYVAQIYPPPAECLRQLYTTISWFIWRGDIFRVPLSTLQRGNMDGGGTSRMCGRRVEHFFYTDYKHRINEMGLSLLVG